MGPNSSFDLFSGIVLGLASAGLLSVGFQVGRSKKVEKQLQSLMGDEIRAVPPELARKHGALAFKALFYGTVLSVSTFSAALVCMKYYYNITSIDDMNTKVKRKVDEVDVLVRRIIEPSLHQIDSRARQSMNNIKPMFGGKLDFDTVNEDELTREKEELRQIGIDPSILEK